MSKHSVKELNILLLTLVMFISRAFDHINEGVFRVEFETVLTFVREGYCIAFEPLLYVPELWRQWGFSGGFEALVYIFFL
jgi:hypothetical protein